MRVKAISSDISRAHVEGPNENRNRLSWTGNGLRYQLLGLDWL